MKEEILECVTACEGGIKLKDLKKKCMPAEFDTLVEMSAAKKDFKVAYDNLLFREEKIQEDLNGLVTITGSSGAGADTENVEK